MNAHNPDNGGVPTFTFCLKDIQQTPPLFQHRSHTTRRTGCITNFRKTTVSHLLEVFRPESLSLKEQQQFLVKKKLVLDSLDMIYSNKKNESISIRDPDNKIRIASQRDASFVTPEKRDKRSPYSSTNFTSRSSSFCKLNYSRREKRFDDEEIQQLRKRGHTPKK